MKLGYFPPSNASWLWIFLVSFLRLLLLLSTITPTTNTITNAFLLKSTGTGGLATSLARNDYGQSLLITGTLYSNNFWNHMFSSNPTNTTQCMLVQTLTDVEDDNTIIHTVQAPTDLSPQICVADALIPSHGVGGTGIVMGTSSEPGEAASLQVVDQLLMGQTIMPSTTLTFSPNSIPVAATIAVNQAVYVALQSTGGEFYEKKNDPVQDLRGLVEYWKTLTQPPVLNRQLEILRYDYLEEDVPFSASLEVPNDGQTSATISSIKVIGETLLVTGSTNANGAAAIFGTSNERNDQDTDWDGFLTFLDTTDGAFQEGMRIASQPGKDDFISDMCIYGDHVYLVGTTSGNMQGVPEAGQGGGFILKMSWQTKEFDYKLTIPGMEKGVKCVASSEGVHVGFYVSKTVNPPGGAIISQDVVITKIGNDIRDGDAMWSQWLDTTDPDAMDSSNDVRQDYLVGMEVLVDTGNIAILMNSMNLEQGLNDIILVELDKDSGNNDLNGSSSNQNSNPTRPQQPSVSPPTPPAPTPTTSNQDKNLEREKENDKLTTIWLAIVIPVFIALAVCMYHHATYDEVEAHGSAQQATDLQLESEQTERQVV